VRATTSGLNDVLRAAFARHVVHGVDAPPNYSVQLGEASAGGASSGFHFLYRSSTAVVRSRDARRILRALVTYLSSHQLDDSRHRDPGLIRMHAVTLVSGSSAVLAPPVLRQRVELIERRLNGRGVRFADTPWALVDPDRGEVIVPEPVLDVDSDALDGLDALTEGRDRPDPSVLPGRYPIAGWAFRVREGNAGRLTRAQAVMQALPMMIGSLERGAQRALDDLTTVVRGIEPAGIAWNDPADVVAPLVALAS
jgi:hypothetical protein